MRVISHKLVAQKYINTEGHSFGQRPSCVDFYFIVPLSARLGLYRIGPSNRQSVGILGCLSNQVFDQIRSSYLGFCVASRAPAVGHRFEFETNRRSWVLALV